MNARTLALCVFAAYLQLAWPTSVAAQCGSGYPWLGYFLDEPKVAAIFGGTVVEVEIGPVVHVVTFNVDRVWKGDVMKRTIIYRAAQPEPEIVGRSGGGGGFTKGHRYVVIAHLLTETERRKFALKSTSSKRLAVDYCGDGSRPFYVHECGTGIGPGTEPRWFAAAPTRQSTHR